MSPASRTTWAVRIVCSAALLLAGSAVGCRQTEAGKWEFKRWDSREPQRGEVWTIHCLETTGAEGRRALESLAEALKRTPNLKAEKVRVEYEDQAARLYYGTYRRRSDPDSGEWRMPPDLRRDMSFIRQLASGPGYPFLHCRPVPLDPGPLGPPEWDLARADGEYSLLVAVYSEIEGRREAAVEHVKLLREQGEAAFYYHDASKSHVCVGAFPASALKETRRGVPRINHPDFVAVKRKHPYFAYNGRYISNVNRDASGRVVSKTRQPTRLIRIPKVPGEGLR